MKHYFLQHWIGGAPPAIAVWVNGIALTIVAVLVTPLAVLGGWQLEPYGLGAFLAAIALAAIMLIAIPVWQIVGLWRTAEQPTLALQSTVMVRATQFVATVLMIFFIARLAGFTGEAIHQAQPALGTGTHRVHLTLLAAGRELELRGRYGHGTARRLQAELDAHPLVRRIRLNSPGGDLDAARELGAVIRKNRLNTLTTELCYGSCILPFVAGQHRSMRRDARIILTDDFDLPESAALYLHGRGVRPEFIELWRRRAGQRWQPGIAELRYGGVVQTVLGAPPGSHTGLRGVGQ